MSAARKLDAGGAFLGVERSLTGRRWRTREADLALVERWPAADVRAGTKWFVDSTMPPLTQAERRETFMRAIPKNFSKVDLRYFLDD